MTVMVDEVHVWPTKIRCFKGGSSHMTTDGPIDELHALAARLGLRREWFQPHVLVPHYDLTPKRREAALKAGAVFVPIREQLRRRRAKAEGAAVAWGIIATSESTPSASANAAPASAPERGDPSGSAEAMARAREWAWVIDREHADETDLAAALNSHGTITEKRGRAAERAEIVAWLRSGVRIHGPGGEIADIGAHLADRIEARAHARGQGGG